MIYEYSNLALYCATLLVAWLLATALYNLFFHPLREVPGPILAKISGLWLFFKDLDKHTHEDFLKLHDHYGPLIRISPNEVSFNDVGIFSEVYSQGSKFDKAGYFYNAFANQDENLFTIYDREKHIQDKRLMSHGFSKTSLLQLEPHMHKLVQKFADRVRTYAQAQREVSLLGGFQCLTYDLISHFAFGGSPKTLDAEDLHNPMIELIVQASEAVPVFQHFPFIRNIIRWASRYQLNIPGASNPSDPIEKAAKQGLAVMESKSDSEWILLRTMIANALKKSTTLRETHLVEEGVLMIVAGTDTTAISMATTTHQLLQKPEAYMRLRQELDAIMPTDGSLPLFKELDRLPYLDACVKEGLRLSSPVRARLPRVVPKGGFSAHGTFLKPGTIISASPLYLLRNRKVFPNPEAFDPDRWMVPEDEKNEMLRYFHPFSKGARQCIGQTLSLMEQKLTLATVVTRFDPVSVAKVDIQWSEVATNALIDTDLYVTVVCREY